MPYVHVIRLPAEISSEAGGVSASFQGELQNMENSQEQAFDAPKVLSRGSRGTHSSTTHSATGKSLDVEELEMLLEAYFVQIDGTLNKLSTVCIYFYKLCFSRCCLDLHLAAPRMTLNRLLLFEL